MERSRMIGMNRQLSRIYSLAILHVILSCIGLFLTYFHLQSYFLFFAILGLNVIALFCFEPWKIAGYLHKGYEYKKGLDSLTKPQPQ